MQQLENKKNIKNKLIVVLFLKHVNENLIYYSIIENSLIDWTSTNRLILKVCMGYSSLWKTY